VSQNILTTFLDKSFNHLRIKAVKNTVVRSEQEEQEVVCRYLDTVHPNILYCASAGGLRTSKRSAVNMKKAGYKKGFPDLFIYQSRGIWHGLAIEMKRLGGKGPTPEQIAWGKALNDRHYQWHVCHGADAAIKVIEHYLR